MDDQLDTVVVRPSAGTIIAKNIITVAGGALVVVLILVALKTTETGQMLVDILDDFGFQMDVTTMLGWMFGAVIVITFLLIIANLIAVRNIYYEFLANEIVIHGAIAAVLPTAKTIPMQNITKVSFHNEGLFNKLFNSGTVKLELSGMQDTGLSLEFVTNAPAVAQHIQHRLQHTAAVRQAEFTQEYRMDKILDPLRK